MSGRNAVVAAWLAVAATIRRSDKGTLQVSRSADSASIPLRSLLRKLWLIWPVMIATDST